jgi:uncharacterized protein (DUF58 family)
MKIHHLAIRYSLVIIGIIFLALMIMDFNSRMAELRRLTAESQVVEQRLVAEAGTQVSLQTQIADASSDHAVRQWAYENSMVGSGDSPIFPMQPADVHPTPTPTRIVVETPVTNVNSWWYLFTKPLAPSSSK